MKTNKIWILFLDFAAVIALAVMLKDYDKNTAVSEYDCQNPYFYTEEQTQIEYEGYFYTYSYRDIWQNIDLYITKLKTFENGVLYTLELEQLEGTDTWDKIALGRRYLGYFYVTDKAIYCASFSPEASSAPEEGYTATENEKIIHQIQTDETAFLEECYIVCCEDGTVDIADENGYHAFVEADGDRRIFRLYNDYFYGSKEYMLIVWEKGNGIVYYMHGNGAKNMHVEFGTDLERQQQTDYGYPYKMFHENADMTEQMDMPNNTDISEDTTISENENLSETEFTQVQETADWINAIIQQNNARIADHLYNFPAEQKWIDISLFDFTNDGKEELLLSKTYVAAGGGAAIFSYYYVYDQQGNELFTFLGGSRDGMHIYADYDKLEFYISSPALRWGAHSDMELYSKIAKRERWEKDFFIAKWDIRSSIEYDDKYLYEFRVPPSYEETLFYNSSEKWVEVRDNTEFRLNEKAFETYLHSFEILQEFPMNIYGMIYCSDGKIIAKLGDRQTELEPNMLSFQLQENIICVYEGLNNGSQLSATGCIAGIYDTYVIYRETQENDIRFVNLLYSAQETGDLYAWKDQYLLPIVEQETGDFYVWNDGDLVLIGTREKKQQDARENPKAKPQKDLPRENMTESELLEQTMDTLHRAGYDETNLIYDGTRHFLNRTYDVVSGFDDFPDHIIRGQEYYIDRETKNVYRVEEEAEFLRTELYYIDTLQ